MKDRLLGKTRSNAYEVMCEVKSNKNVKYGMEGDATRQLLQERAHILNILKTKF